MNRLGYTNSWGHGVLYITLALLICHSPLYAQTSKDDFEGEFSGMAFSDLYWIPNNHDQDIVNNNGFWIRRVYFTYNRQINNSFSTRFRLESNSEGDFITSSKMTPVVKDLYLKWENEHHQVLTGISGTPTWGLVEDVWGYRSVEKSPLDLLNFGSSRDIGISIKGNIDPEERLKYHFMIGNGSSNKSEINQGKKIMGSLSYMVTDQIVLEAYADWNDNNTNNDWITLQSFAAYRSDNFNAGLLYAHQTRKLPDSDLNLDLVSAFSNFSITDQTRGYIRVDHTFNAIPDIQNNDYFPISNQAEATIIVAGMDFELASGVHLMPNIEAAIYGEGFGMNAQPDTDFIPRLTGYYAF